MKRYLSLFLVMLLMAPFCLSAFADASSATSVKLDSCVQVIIPAGYIPLSSSWMNDSIEFISSTESYAIKLSRTYGISYSMSARIYALKQMGYSCSSYNVNGITVYYGEKGKTYALMFDTDKYSYDIWMTTSYKDFVTVIGNIRVQHTASTPSKREATCTEAGYTEAVYCTVCNKKLSDRIDYPAKGHIDQNKDNKCDVCGATLFIKKSGDLNADGIIDLKDSRLMLQYLAGWDVSYNEINADVNNDGAIDLKDSRLILQYLAGWPSDYIK